MLRAQLSILVARFRSTDLVPSAMVDALDGLAMAPAHPAPRVVIIGELGRGSRALANRLAGTNRLKAGPSQRGAAALLDIDPQDASPRSLLQHASIEVAPPLASGAETTSEGVIPTLMRADVVVFALSAAQLLSAAERRLLTGLAGLTSAPIALAVGRMEVVETEEDLDDVIRRTGRFRDTLQPAPEVFLLPGETDDAPRLQAWILQRLADVAVDTALAWEARAQHLLSTTSALLDAAAPNGDAQPDLSSLLRTLEDAHTSSRRAARAHLEDGLSIIRDTLSGRMADMTPEERIHEGASELSIAIEALLRGSIDLWRTQLTSALADADLLTLSLGPASDQPDTVSAVTGEAPKLTARLPDQSYGLMAAALGLSVGVLMLPTGGTSAIALGLGLTAGSAAAARVLHDRREDRLRQVHAEALDSWLREVGLRAEDWMVDHLDRLHSRIATRLGELHDHAVQHRASTSPAALHSALDALRQQLHQAAPVGESPQPS